LDDYQGARGSEAAHAEEEMTVQQAIAGEERAIRHLIGERKALNSKLARLEAQLKLNKAKLAKIDRSPKFKSLAKNSRFPDVSNNNAVVNVAEVRKAAKIKVGDLLVTKITEGLTFIDRPGLLRAKGMEAAGFPRRGFYAFVHPSQSGEAQAQFFLKTLDDAGVKILPSDILICDGEVSDGQSAATVRSCFANFGHELKKHYNNVRWLYGGGPFAEENGITLDGYDAHWLAAYVDNPRPYMHFGSRTKAWQFTDGRNGPGPHSCPGIGNCDLSVVLN
jgi:lysozyme